MGVLFPTYRCICRKPYVRLSTDDIVRRFHPHGHSDVLPGVSNGTAARIESMVRERTAEVAQLYQGLEKEKLFRSLSENVPVGIFQTDVKGIPIFSNLT